MTPGRLAETDAHRATAFGSSTRPSAGRYVGVSLITGLAFAVLDGVLNGNPIAVAAYGVFSGIARPGINILAGLAIDAGYGFALAAIFLLLYPALPGYPGPLKGLSYALLVWFFRVVMNAAGQWVMFTIPLFTVAYGIVAGLFEMLLLGALLGFLLKPASSRVKEVRRDVAA